MKALLDTNAVIYLQKGVLAKPLPKGLYFISVITEMELLDDPEFMRHIKWRDSSNAPLN